MNWKSVKALANVAKATIVKHGPEILMGVGAVSFVTTIIFASKETVEEQKILEDHEDYLDYLENCHEVGELDDKAYKKSKVGAYKDLALETTKNYIPSLGFGSVSMVCFFGAYGIMRKRYATLAVAYTALEESFRLYRQRVIADKGVEQDIYYLTGSKVKEITVKDNEGNKTKLKSLQLPDGSISSPYAFKFSKYKENGEINQQWSNNRLLNSSYVYGQIDYINNQILYNRTVFDDNYNVIVRGWVMLNEFRELLGEDGTTTGAVVGNRFGNGEPGCNGYLNPIITEATEIDPETGEEIPCMFIDPNVDGLIYDLIGKKEPKPFAIESAPWAEDYNIV